MLSKLKLVQLLAIAARESFTTWLSAGTAEITPAPSTMPQFQLF